VRTNYDFVIANEVTAKRPVKEAISDVEGETITQHERISMIWDSEIATLRSR